MKYKNEDMNYSQNYFYFEVRTYRQVKRPFTWVSNTSEINST